MAEIRRKRRKREDVVFAALSCLSLLLCAWFLLRSSGAANQNTRRPASIDKVETPSPIPKKSRVPVTAEQNSVSTMSPICFDKGEPQVIQTAATMIRLQLRKCGNKNEAMQPVDGVNRTNRFSLEFLRAPKSEFWTSSYFQLSPGKNEVSLRLQKGKDQYEEKHLSIVSGK